MKSSPQEKKMADSSTDCTDKTAPSPSVPISVIRGMIGYLNITGLKLALLLNFKNAKLDWKRVVR
jgi:hypothetical protein